MRARELEVYKARKDYNSKPGESNKLEILLFI